MFGWRFLRSFGRSTSANVTAVLLHVLSIVCGARRSAPRRSASHDAAPIGARAITLSARDELRNLCLLATGKTTQVALDRLDNESPLRLAPDLA